jgi:tetratricopeptide (TPR) repeat protein
MDKAFECLSTLDSKGALKIGRKLKTMKYSGAFEVIALAHTQDGQVDKAVECLEEGVKKCPDVWLLWQLLGNYRSDLNEFAQAMICLEKAALCPNADTSSINLNKAICFSRQELHEQTLEMLEGVTSSETRIQRESLLIGSLVSLERFDEAILRGEAIAKEIGDSAEFSERYNDELCRTFCWLAHAYLEGRKDRERARSAIQSAIKCDNLNASALAALRELNNQTADGNEQIWIMVEGRWNAPIEGFDEYPGFFTTYWVVASSPEEALTFARELDPEDVRSSLTITEQKTEIREPWQSLKGVYVRTPYNFYPWKKKCTKRQQSKTE